MIETLSTSNGLARFAVYFSGLVRAHTQATHAASGSGLSFCPLRSISTRHFPAPDGWVKS
ncbi:exported hypothetical protein [Candidatus Accumulibacter aalborgensis]|uniref:Uncharacterized protein n=1 Tax=Candidatus Accumulibacter aalborgensis TaxID=1860102 RepID=A0A1A8XKA2_9PROT|nr:exported hypothetical protein [Candidatus Accumulibacter aalborgensis]